MSVKIVAEYVWLDGNGELRSKAKTVEIDVNNKTQNILPEWNYDGSSTGQASGINSEIILKPQAMCKCPFRRDKNILVMCDTYKPDGTPLKGNNRHWAKELFDKKLDEHPWFGIEQEFFLMSNKTGKPLGFSTNKDPSPQGQYYCSVGSNNAFGREILDVFYEHCLFAGLTISGINAEVAIGQWEYQIGPLEGINAGDELYLARYILQRVTEKFDVTIDLHPKPLDGDWNGSGCHTNYSTKLMREGLLEQKKVKSQDSKENILINVTTGLEYIETAVNKLSLKHTEHMKLYGKDNELRMTGMHETAKYDTFNYGVGNRAASVRIPNSTIKDNRGYFEDRRPASNMDPYLVTGLIFQTTVLDEENTIIE
tara:strand:+ start:7156 stop:8259 length:1104 start_codon:yes stop_codon:yes gene_type:complete